MKEIDLLNKAYDALESGLFQLEHCTKHPSRYFKAVSDTADALDLLFRYADQYLPTAEIAGRDFGTKNGVKFERKSAGEETGREFDDGIMSGLKDVELAYRPIQDETDKKNEE